MPKHSHIIEAESAEEFAKAVCDLYCQLNSKTAPPVSTPTTPPAAPAKAKKATKKPEAAPSESLPGDDAVEEEVASEEETVEAATEGTTEADPFADDDSGVAPSKKAYTLKDINDIGKKVVETKGLLAAKEILQKFGVQKPGSLKETDYAKFIDACNKAMK